MHGGGLRGGGRAGGAGKRVRGYRCRWLGLAELGVALAWNARGRAVRGRRAACEGIGSGGWYWRRLALRCERGCVGVPHGRTPLHGKVEGLIRMRGSLRSVAEAVGEVAGWQDVALGARLHGRALACGAEGWGCRGIAGAESAGSASFSVVMIARVLMRVAGWHTEEAGYGRPRRTRMGSNAGAPCNENLPCVRPLNGLHAPGAGIGSSGSGLILWPALVRALNWQRRPLCRLLKNKTRKQARVVFRRCGGCCAGFAALRPMACGDVVERKRGDRLRSARVRHPLGALQACCCRWQPIPLNSEALWLS